MPLFFRKTTAKDNRIENAGQWPVRLTNFHLVEDYEHPPAKYPEIFIVRDGTFLHQTDESTRSVRRGTIIVNHPSNQHKIKNPEKVVVTRVRFLPEWMARDYGTIIEAPDLLSLFFKQSWFQYPSDTTMFAFSARDESMPLIEAELDLLEKILGEGRTLDSLTRITFLKLLLLISDEFFHFWRGGERMDLRSEVREALDMIERCVLAGDSLKLKQLEPATGMSQDHLARVFKKATGVTLVDYVQRRRIHHAALRLLTTDATAKSISEELGFSDSAHFSKSFQKYFDVSPNVYRQKFSCAVSSGKKDEEKSE